ncbi:MULTISPECIES: hypothetical protein [Ralstonia solanacearum species complex]|uniref:hypothetical protein n=1 Tax=Ralstonia solanacearum species complex TaxID=3116862 RepID=UPI00078B300F|nr:hypothetical protein [Ralstonia solanacearum]BEU72148.1 hypothetical protein MAFF211271_17030 [Ralstonia pseudosolanacearum]AMP37646.1 hypothetical protein LBM2029_08900 [Ralstonia solanacearum]AXV77039.1 hypothetical protein CJO76_08685 [Ralstonia solanacearum]AXV86472.1 hypothetical protein CJO78_09220 [Ralstonia solanacearum]AXV91055.1 hypothetical protein CJO79_08665 [Ralstonia solanacearum]
MLAKGVQLSLLIGPVIPVPVPRIVLDALDSVEVRTAAGSASGFQLKFQITARSELNTIFLIAAGTNTSMATPPLRVMLIVTLNGTPQPLFDGVMTNVDVQAGSQGQPGTLTVTGEDVTKVMDMQDFSGLPFPAMPVEARVALLCAKYAAFGVIPLPVPILFPDVQIPIDKIPAQQGTDLQYIQELARQVGYVFYIEPGPTPGTNIAYFGPEIKVGVPQPALNIDMDALTNVESLNFSFDPTKGVLPVVFIQNPLTRVPIPIPIPNLNPLQPPLGALPTPISNLKILKDTAKLNPMQAISRGLAEAAKSQDAVTGHGGLNVLRYGRVLKARGLVGVRGAGVAYDGLYYVQSVTSTLKRGEFKQSFSLTRNGLVSITPRVPV